MKHKDNLSEARELQGRGLDQAHRTMKSMGFSRFMFWTFAGLDAVGTSTKAMCLFEFKTFLLLEPPMNTVDQQGAHTEHKVIN